MGNNLRNTAQPEGLYTYLRDASEESPVQHVPDERWDGNRHDNALMTYGSAPFPEPQTNTGTAHFQDPLLRALHPWGMVDYYLYLSMVEKKTVHERRNGMYILNGDECYPISERDLFDPMHFGPEIIEQGPKLLFNVLPIPLNSGNGRAFGTREYVLGFDFNTSSFFARHFNPFPPIEHLLENWDRGTDVHSISIIDLLELLSTYFTGVHEAGTGILSSSPYSPSLRQDDPGFEIVLVILFCQWLTDMTDLIFDSDDDEEIDECLDELRGHMETCYLVLQRASCRAWFAVRDGVSSAEYNRRLMIERITSDLFV